MNVTELIERLAELDPGAEVMLATQPSWPLQSRLAGVASSADLAMDLECAGHGDYSCDECAGQDEPVVYLVEGDAADQPYAPRAAWEVAS
jgi:hypothetical protein